MGFAGPLTVTTPTETQIVVTREFDAPRHLVFACHTQPALIRRWLNGAEGWVMTVCEFEPRVGGRYRYEWRAPDGYVMGMGGTIREIEPVERIVSAELFDEDWTGGETVAVLRFDDLGERTRLVNTLTYSSPAARDGALRTPMAEGMEMGFRTLDAVLAEEWRADWGSFPSEVSFPRKRKSILIGGMDAQRVDSRFRGDDAVGKH